MLNLRRWLIQAGLGITPQEKHFGTIVTIFGTNFVIVERCVLASLLSWCLN